MSFIYLLREFANGAANKAGEEAIGIAFSFLTVGFSDITKMFKTIRIE